MQKLPFEWLKSGMPHSFGKTVKEVESALLLAGIVVTPLETVLLAGTV